MACVLKPKHTLVGKNLLPMILEMKADGEPPVVLGRLKNDHPLENYDLEELSGEFRKLTGEDPRDILQLVGKDFDLIEMRTLVHHAVVYCNSVGGPKSTPLVTISTASSVVTTGSSSATIQATPSSASSSGTSVRASTTGTHQGDLETRLRQMEENLNDFKNSQSIDKVDEALKNVRTLANRPKLTSASVLLAALEVLVHNATKTGHKDAEFYSKALQACRQHEENPDICTLCLKLLGSSEDKKISNAVAEWIKSSKPTEKPDDRKHDALTSSNNQSFIFPPFQGPFGAHFGHQPYMTPGGPMMPPFSPQPTAGRGFRPKAPSKRFLMCFYCKEKGHFVSECPKIKKQK